jgi:hypothetical protein
MTEPETPATAQPEAPKKKRVGQYQRDQTRDWKLSRIKAKNRRYTAAGKTLTESSTGSAVIYCPTCQAAVVASEMGRKAHVQRMPKCREALGL